MPWVYLLECADGSYYVGSTRLDLAGRLAQHASGHGSAYTSPRLPIRLRWSCFADDMTDAWAFERRVHGWSRRKRKRLISGDLEVGSPAVGEWARWWDLRERR